MLAEKKKKSRKLINEYFVIPNCSAFKPSKPNTSRQPGSCRPPRWANGFEEKADLSVCWKPNADTDVGTLVGFGISCQESRRSKGKYGKGQRKGWTV